MHAFPAACRLALALLPFALAQQPQFRSRVDLVQVDVVVIDRRGNPVTGLTAADFAVIADGQPQTVSQFAAFEIPLGSRQVDRRDIPAPQDVFSNEGPPAPRALVIVIDSFHLTTDAEDLERLRQALASMLTNAAEQDDVAIVFTGRSDLSVPFTRDPARQIRAINNVKTAATPRARRSTREAVVDVQTSLWTVRNVIRVLSGSPYSRRAILYVGEGSVVPLMPPGGGEVLEQVRMTVEAATRAGVVMYGIDPRGVLDAFEYRTHRVQRDFLSALVLDTGGRVVAGAADTRGEIRKVIRENGAFYVLGFVPAPLPNDDKFHAIEVRVRNPDWRVMARKGYYAAARAASGDGRSDPAAAIEAALEAGIPLAGIPLRAAAAPIAIAADGKVRTLLTVSVASAETRSRSWDVAAVAMTPDGRVLDSISEPLQARDDSGPYRLHRALDLAPGIRPVRIVVRDRETGEIGSLHLPLEIPDLAGERMAIGSTMFGTTSGAAALPDVPLPGFEPTTDRDFTGDEGPAVLTSVFWRPKDGPTADVTMAIERAGKVIAMTTGPVSGVPLADRYRGALLWPLPLRGLQPGAYELTVTVAQDGRRAAQTVPFRMR